MNKKDKNKITIEAYDKNSRFYSDKFDVYGIRIDDINRALKLVKSETNQFLELGCGNGRDANYIVSQIGSENYTGIDASEELIKIARVKNPDVTFHVKDMRDISFDPETFGGIFSFYSLLHMNHQELEGIIKKCHKWLKIGGILYISSKYGEHKEIEIKNLGDVKYYYSYEPEDIEGLGKNLFQTVYKTIFDSDYGPSFTIALKKI